MPEAKARKKYNVSPEEFVVAWEESGSVDEVSSRLGMPKPNVTARASSYRAKGVTLKQMPRGGNRRLDVENLNDTAGRVARRSTGPWRRC